MNFSVVQFSRSFFFLVFVVLFASLAECARSTKSTLLILTRDANGAQSTYSGLQGYGIPYRVILVPKDGVQLPSLTSGADSGNFGGFVIMNEVSYDYGVNDYHSALTAEQWEQLYSYQRQFGVRMVRLNAYPGPAFGKSSSHTN